LESQKIKKEFSNAIVLTGGIASGKSSVCSLLSLYGFQVIDADKTAHRLLDENRIKIVRMFGKEYVDGEKVDRKKLGSLVFEDETQRKKLEALLHPLIKERLIERSRLCESKNIPYILEIPLFFEKRNYAVDETVVVYCKKEQQIQRLLKRENFTLQEVRSRLNAQMSLDEKKELASYVIDNTKDLKHLQAEVDKFISYIKEKYPNIRL